MGDVQSACEDGELPDNDAPEEDRDTLLKNNGQIAGKSESPLGDVNGIRQDDQAQNESPPKLLEVETVLENVVGVDKEPIRVPEEEEEISLKVMEVEAKQNDVNESFKTFFNKVGLKFALKRGSRDETVAKEEKEEEEEEEEEAADLENTRTKAGVLEEEWTHLDTLAEDDVTMSPIKKFFSTGIFAGRLQKKRVSLEDETMTRETFLQTEGEAADPLNSDIPLGDEEDNPTLVDPETPKEMEYVPSSPLKKLLLGSRLAMLKRQKDEKEIEEAKAVGMSDQLDVAENDMKQSPEEEGSPWTTFKKLLSPKKRVNKPGSTSDEAQNSKDEEDHILERKDSWDAIVPGQSQSVSDPVTIPAGVDDAEAVENDDHAGEGDAGPAGDEAGSAWDTFKRLMSPKRKARIPERGGLSPEPEDGRENSFSAKFFPAWKKRKSIPNKDQEAPSCQADEETVAGDVTPEKPALVPLSNYDGGKVESKEMDDTSTPAESEVNPEPREGDPSSETLGTGETRPNMETSENWAADEDLVELIELVEKALSDITEEGDFTESTKVEDPMEPPGHVDDEMISAPRASGAPPQVLESSQVGPPRECLGQVEDVLQADVPSSNEIARCDTLERFGEDREALEVPKSSATDLPKTDLDADESESFEFIKMSEVNTEEVNSAPIKAENLGTLATPHFISTTDLDCKEIVTCVPTKILEANDITHPIQIQSATPALRDDQDIASWNPTKDLDEEIRSPICSEEHELEDLNNTATPIPTEEIAPSCPTKEEMTPTIPALEADTKEITSPIPSMDLNSDKIRPETPTEERVAPIPPEKSHVEETKALMEETTPHILTEELETGERTTPPEDLETEEVSTSLLIEKLDPEEVRTTVPTEDHEEETKPPTLETVDPSTERIQSQENSLPTEDHKEETKPPTLETVDPSIERIQSQENSLPTEDPDAKQIKRNVLVDEIDAQEATTRVPTEEFAKEQMGFSSEEYELEEITPPIRLERLDAEETTPTSTKEPNAERTVSATASIPPEELTTQEIESPIGVEVLQSEEIGTPPSQEHPTENIPPPPSAKHLETKKMATSLPTEDLNIQEINLSIPTTELNGKNIIPPKPIEELKEIRPSKPSGTEEIPPPALMKALAAQELISAIPLDQEIRPPTEIQDTKGITASILAEELTTVIREEVFNPGENPPQILVPPTCERTEIPPAIIKELDTQELTSPIASKVVHLEERMPSTPTEVEADGEETTPSILTVELDSKMAAPIHTEEPTSPIPTADDLSNREIWCQTPTEEPDTEEISPLTSEKTESEELPIKKLDIQELTSSYPPDEEVRPHTPTEEEEETKEIAPETSTEHEEELDMKDIVPLTSEKTESGELAAPIPLKDLAIQELMPPFPPDGLHNQETRSTTPPEEITSLNSSPSEKTTTERKAAVLTTELDVVTIAFPNKELHHQEISPPIPTEESAPTTLTMELDSPIAPEDVDTLKNTAQIHSLQLDTKKVLPPIPTDVLETDTIVPTNFSQMSDGEESTSVPTEELDLDVITPPIPTEDIDTKEMSPPILTDTKDIPPSIPTKDLAREEMIAPPLILSDKVHDQNERSAKSTEDQDTEEAMPAVELDPKEISAPIATQVEDTPEIPGQELDTQNMVPLIPTDEQDKDTIVLQTDLEKTKPSILRGELDLEETSPAILTRELHTEDLPPVKVIGIEAPNPAKELQNEEMRPPIPIEELLWDEIPSQELDPKEIAPEETNLLESEQSAPTNENREFLGGLTDVNPLDNENIAETFQCTDQSEAEAPKVDHQESVSMGEPENKDGLIEQLQLKETDAEEEEAIAKHAEDQRVRETWENSPDAFTEEPTSGVLEARALVDEAGLPLVQDEILSKDATEMQSSETVRTEENHLVNEPVDSFKDVRIEEMEAVKSEKAETVDEDQLEEDTGILLQIQEKQTPPLDTAGLTAAQELKFQPETIDVRHVESKDDIRGDEPLMEKIQEDQLPLLGSDLGPEEKYQEASRPSECQTEQIKEEQEEIQDLSVTIQEISAVHGLAEETTIAQNVPLTEDASVREDKKVGVECEDDKEPDRRPQESETKEMEEKTVPQLPACVQSTKDNPLDANPFDVETVQDSEEAGQSPWTAATEETILAEEKTMENLKEDTVAVTGVQPESDQIAEDQVKTEANTKKAEAAEERSVSESIAGERSASVEFTDEAFHLPEMNVELEDEDKDEGLNEKVVQSEALTSDEANRRPEDILAEESVLDEAHKEAEPFPEATLESVNENETVGEIDRTEAILAESPQTEALSSDQAQLLEKPRPQVRTPVLELIEESMTLIPPDGTYVEDIPKAATEIKPQPSQALDGETPEPENTYDNLSGDENQQDGTEEHAALHQEKMSCAHILENVIYDNTNTIFGLPADGIKPEVDPIATETRIDGPEVTAATAELALVTQVITCHFKEIFPSLAGVLEIPSGVQEPLPVSEVRDITETALSDTHSMTDDIAGVAKMAAEVLTAHTPATEDIYSFRVEISSAEKSTGQPLEAGLREDKVVSDVCLERVEASVSTGVAEETWEDQAMFHQEIFSHIYQTQPETLDKVVLEEAKEISLGTDDGAPRPEVETREDYVVVGYESFLDVNQSQEVLKPADEPEQATDDGTVRPLGISSKETSEDLEETSQGGIFETSRKPDGEMLKERLTDEEKDQSQEGFSSSETSIQIDLDEPQSTDAANEDTHTRVAGKTSSPTDTGENICSSEPLDDGKTMRTEVSDQEPQDADPTEVGILAPETEYITLLDTVFRHQELMEQGLQTLVAEESSSQAPPQNLITEVGIVILDSVDFVTNHEASATSVQAQGTQESPSQRAADENQIPAAIPNDVIAPQDLTELQTQIERENRESTVDEGSTENQKPMTQLEDRDETRENRESIVDEGSTENQKPTEQSEEHEESIADEGSTDNQESLAQEEYMECQEQISLSKEDEETRENQDWIAQREDTETQKQRLGSEDRDRPENQESFSEKESTENWKEIEVSNERDETRENPESVAQGESTDLQKQTHLSEGLDPSRENQDLVARGESTDLQKQTHLSEGIDPSRENQESLSIEEFTGNQKETEVSQGHEELGETQKESTGNQEEPEKLEKHDLEKENISPLFPRGTSETQKEAKPADSPNPTLTSLEISDSEIPVDIAILLDLVPQPMETFPAPTSEAERIEAVEQIPLVLEIAATEMASPVKEADDEQDVWMDAEEDVQIQEEADTFLAQDGNQDGHLSPAPERPKTPPEPQSDDFAMAPEDPEIGNVASLE